MRAVVLLAPLLAGAGVAGCLADEASTPAREGEAASPPEPSEAARLARAVSLEACDEHAGIFPLAEGEAREHLPEGFEPADPLLGTDAVAALEVYARTCGPSDGATPREVMALIPVEPPEEHRNDSAARHLVQVWGATTDAAHQEVYESWGLPFHHGDVFVDLTATPAAGTGETSIHQEGETVGMTTAVEGRHEPFDGGSARIYGVGDGNVTGAADIEWTASQARMGEAALTSRDPLPVSPESEGLGAHLWGFQEVWRPTELPGDGEG